MRDDDLRPDVPPAAGPHVPATPGARDPRAAARAIVATRLLPAIVIVVLVVAAALWLMTR